MGCPGNGGNQVKAFSFIAVLLSFWLGTAAFAVEVVTERGATCEEYRLNRDLPVYKDPTLFLSALKEAGGDREAAWNTLMSESPLITTVKGKVSFMRLGPDQSFKNFGVISRLYELYDPRLKVKVQTEKSATGAKAQTKETTPLIVPVMFCGSGDAYSDTLGFVLLKDLQEAQKARAEAKAGLPPSTFPNPIPEWKNKGG